MRPTRSLAILGLASLSVSVACLWPTPTNSRQRDRDIDGPRTPEEDRFERLKPPEGWARAGARGSSIRTLIREDVDETGARELLAELVRAIEQTAPTQQDVLEMLNDLEENDRRLTAELLATAIGMTRLSGSLHGLLQFLDGFAIDDADDALQFDRLLNGFISSRRGDPAESSPETRCRFAVQRRHVAEPFVRDWLIARIHSVVEGGGLEANAVLWRLALGYTMGEIRNGDADQLVRVAETAPPIRRATIVQTMGYSTSPVLRDWLTNQLHEPSSTDELRYVVASLSLAGLRSSREVDHLARLIAPSSTPETVIAVARGLQEARPADVDLASIAERLLSISFEAAEGWSRHVRAQSLATYRLLILSGGYDHDGVQKALRSFLRAPHRAEVFSELGACLPYLRPHEATAFVDFLKDTRVRDLDLVSVLRRLAKTSFHLSASQEEALWERIEGDGRVPSPVRAAARKMRKS